MGSQFVIKTDQQSIKHLLSQPLISDRHIKWAAFIQRFQPILQYHPGKENVVADTLSRRPQLNHMSVIEGISFASMPDTYEHDEDFKEVWLHIHEHPTHTLVDYTLRDNFLYFKRKLCVTKPFRSALIEELHKPPYAGHRGIAATFQNVCHDFF